MMTKDKILALFRRMLSEHWAYVWGAAEEGTVDCSGAFVWAYRQAGMSVYHGSNRMARVETPKLLPINQARPGMIAYKARDPTEAGYALPDSYKPGGSHYNGDVRDYYHVGLVDEDPRYVLNARSPKDGFVRSPITQGWDAVGYGKQIDYGTMDKGDETMAQTAAVTAPSGSTVNLRAKPDTNGALVERVPVGEEVMVVSVSGAWAEVDYWGHRGYMMTQYLDMGGEDAAGAEGDLAAAWEAIRKLEERVQALEGGVG